jgi:hypothetical protein
MKPEFSGIDASGWMNGIDTVSAALYITQRRKTGY